MASLSSTGFKPAARDRPHRPPAHPAQSVKAFRPGGVGGHERIVHLIHISVDAVLHSQFALSGQLPPLFEGGIDPALDGRNIKDQLEQDAL